MVLYNHFLKNLLIIILVSIFFYVDICFLNASPAALSEKTVDIKSYNEFINGFKKMQSLQDKDGPEYKKLESLYKKGTELLRLYKSGELDISPDEGEKLEPRITFLEAGLYFHKPDRSSRKVLDIFHEFEKQFPDSSDLFLNVSIIRIRCYQDLGLNDSANEEIDSVANVNSTDTKGFTALYELAENLFSEAEASDDRGEEEIAKKNRADALLVYRKLYALSKLKPDYKKYRNPILYRIVRIYMNKDHLFNALALYNNMLRADPLSADEIYALGLLYEKTDQWEDALRTWRLFSDGVKPGTDHWFEARYRRAVALEALGRVDKACDMLTVTLLLHPYTGSETLTNMYVKMKETLCMGE